MKYFQSTNLY